MFALDKSGRISSLVGSGKWLRFNAAEWSWVNADSGPAVRFLY